MTDLKIIMRIARTDLAILFYSPIAWFILIVFSFLTTASFTSLMENIVTDYDLSGGKEVSLSGICFLGSYGFLSSVVSNIYIYIPLLTMGLISRETASGSIKLAYSSPVTSGQIVLGKYLAAIGFGCCLMLVPIASAIYGSLVIPSFDWAPVLVALLGLYLLICAYCAIGLFMSSLTTYQVVAAVGTLIILAILNFVGKIGQEYDFIRELTYWLSINGRTIDMLNGVIRSEDVIYFVVVVTLFLTFTTFKLTSDRRTISRFRQAISYLGFFVAAMAIGYFTSRPGMIKVWDTTRTKLNSLTENSQHVLAKLTGPVTITNYVNLLDNKSYRYLPIMKKANETIFEPYCLAKPDLQVKYVYYYDFAPNGVANNPKFQGKTVDEMRAELGVFELKVKKENAHQLIQDNFLFYDKLARHKKITYTLHSELEEKEELFDPNYLELIVNNLLSNAFKYTESGQSITVTLKEENNWLVLQVSDTGIGIPINKQGKIFERFYQIESEHVGSGIGLSLVQRLVELHHGRIELDSEEGKGSTFSVYLPQDINIYKSSELASNDAKNEEDQVYSTNSKEMYFIDTEKVENETIETGDKKRGTILIVEDNNEIRHYLSSGLAELFNTLEAGNGEEALEKLKENEVDIIVTDVMMPVMDGIKLCKNVKQNIRTCHIPVIILSAKSETKDQMEGLQMGADDYIPKPFSLAILTTKIQNMMRTRRRMLERYSKSLEVEPEKITFNAMDEALLKRAVAIVEKNMDNIEFSTDEFAREMNMSRSNLHLKLKAITGESTIDFIRKIRFNEAAKLLKDGRYTIAEVSTMVGFNTPSYFATSFKKYFGCLPTEYIKKAKG